MDKELTSIISGITKWATQNPNVDSNYKRKDLKSALLKLYNYCLLLNPGFDENNYAEFQGVRYDEIYKQIGRNLPELGLYPMVSSTDVLSENVILTSDAVDDLADIIIMLHEFEWRLDNTSHEDALWNMKSDFNTHIENHLAGLIYYLSQLNE